MSYQLILSRMIEQSGLTLKEISERCKQIGQDIAPSYISKLQTGKHAAASDEITIAIAKACGEDPSELLFEGNLTKTPELIKSFVMGVINYYREKEKASMRGAVPQEDEEFLEGLIDDTANFTFFTSILKMIDNYSFDDVNNFEGFFETISPLEQSYSFKLSMPDDSLYPIIKKDWELEIEKVDHPENGDFIGVIIDEDTLLFRKYIEIEDNRIVLVAENKKFPPILMEKHKMKIIGKISKVLTNL